MSPVVGEIHKVVVQEPYGAGDETKVNGREQENVTRLVKSWRQWIDIGPSFDKSLAVKGSGLVSTLR